MINKNKFKANLKQLRQDLGLSQKELSIKTGISQSTIARWENGDRTPEMNYLIILAKFFGVSIDYLVGLTD